MPMKNAISTRTQQESVDQLDDGYTLKGGQAQEESRPWDLKELCPGKDPIVESVQIIPSYTIRKVERYKSNSGFNGW